MMATAVIVTEIIFHSYINSSFPLAIENDILCCPGSKKKKKISVPGKTKSILDSALTKYSCGRNITSFVYVKCLLVDS